MLRRFWSSDFLDSLEDSTAFLVVTLHVEGADRSLVLIELVLCLHFLLRLNLGVFLDYRRCEGDRRLNLLYLLELYLRSLGLLLDLSFFLLLEE